MSILVRNITVLLLIHILVPASVLLSIDSDQLLTTTTPQDQAHPCYDSIDLLIGCFSIMNGLAEYTMPLTSTLGIEALNYFDDLDNIIEDAIQETEMLCQSSKLLTRDTLVACVDNSSRLVEQHCHVQQFTEQQIEELGVTADRIQTICLDVCEDYVRMTHALDLCWSRDGGIDLLANKIITDKKHNNFNKQNCDTYFSVLNDCVLSAIGACPALADETDAVVSTVQHHADIEEYCGETFDSRSYITGTAGEAPTLSACVILVTLVISFYSALLVT